MITNISREDVCIVVQSWFKFPYCFTLIIIHYHTPQKRGIKFKPRKKLNHKTGGHFACAWVHPLNDIELAHQIWWREIEKSRKVTVLLKAILLMLWIPYFPTKDVLPDFSTRVFSCRFFSSSFSWNLRGFKETQSQKSLFLYKSDFHWQSNAFLWTDFQTHGLTYQGRIIS